MFNEHVAGTIAVERSLHEEFFADLTASKRKGAAGAFCRVKRIGSCAHLRSVAPNRGGRGIANDPTATGAIRITVTRTPTMPRVSAGCGFSDSARVPADRRAGDRA